MTDTAELLDVIGRSVDAGGSLAVATVIETRGSTPREVGAKMLIRPDGGIAGTIGGGCGEADVWRAALDVIDTKVPESVFVDLTQEMNLQSEAVCGGTMRIFVEPRYPAGVPSEEGVAPPGDGYAAAIRAALLARRPAALVTVVRGDPPLVVGAHMLVTPEQSEGSLGVLAADTSAREAAKRVLCTVGTRPFLHRLTGLSGEEQGEAFIELFLPVARLLILGAGHIAVPLAHVAQILDFEVTVWDDRAAFANRQRFPTVHDVRVAGFDRDLAGYVSEAVDERTFVVLVTRGHQQDVPALRALLASKAPYIGMIGSKRRVWTVLKLLHGEGVPAEQLLRVYAPVGLDIEAITPAEIAVAICGELVKILRGGKARSLSEATRELFQRRFGRLSAPPDLELEAETSILMDLAGVRSEG
ncbi:MAG: XdhC family protein [Chloroflexi bacterium]|nr:XdhC family protein [Chloroflexota bacterium]